MESGPDLNRRKYPRVRTDSIVSIRRVSPIQSLAGAVDLSLGGIRFQCFGIELELGERLQVTLTLGSETLEVEGTLVRLTELDAFTQEAALAFGTLDPATLEVLKDHLPESYEVEVGDQ